MTPLPCQLCKKDARRPAPYTWCETSGCLMYGNTAYAVEKWNALQTAIVELQRAAFEAGYALAVHQEMGSGKMDWSKSRSSPQLFGENYGDEEYDGVDAFDFYLAERSAK